MKYLKMRDYRFILILLLIGIFGSACSAAGKLPTVRNYNPPVLKVEGISPQTAGCEANEYSQIICAPESPLGQLGCSELAIAGDYLGGLEPDLPLGLCLVVQPPGNTLPSGEYIYRDGCMLPRYIRYVIQQDGQLQVIHSLDELQATFAPITSENEALSYALAATGLSAYYGQMATKGWRYFVNQIEDTHVVSTDKGYLVYLYDYQLCGCGPHTTEYVEVLVTSNGDLEETGHVPAFEDPEQDGLCVD